MKDKKPILYSAIVKIVSFFYKEYEFVGMENLPDDECIIAGNHSQLNGPLVGELYFPKKPYIWCAYEMMELREVPAYTYWDFWRNKPKYIKWWFKIASYLIAPLSVFLFNNARTIAAYHDRRAISTIRNTIKHLKNGTNILIFPEQDKPKNHIVCDFQEGFVDIARTYFKQTGKELKFVPLYLAPKFRKAYIGKPITFCSENSIKEERKRICEYLMEEITTIATQLPLHKVIPYNNMSKKDYNYNRIQGEKDEKTSC